jgi:Tfp pilus assembly protein PilV
MSKLLKHSSTNRRQRGDTIVEVMIAVAVVGAVLVSAFTLTNRSTRIMRDAEEHAQANQLLQGQVERLRSVASQMKSADFPVSNFFCFDEVGTLQPLANSSTFGCLTGTYYSFSIEKLASNPGDLTTKFALDVQWDSITGNKAAESITYKIALRP